MPDRLLSGLIVVAATIIIGTLVYRVNTTGDTVRPASSATVDEKEEARSTQMKARLTSCRREDSGRIIAEGHVTNIGNTDLRFAVVRVLWQKRTDQTIEDSELYVLNDEVLPPGESKAFISSTDSMSAVRCNVQSLDWW